MKRNSEEEQPGRGRTWIEYLTEDDLAFVRRFILASGSLKELAQAYGISYPTVRLRLDRLIEKIELLEDQAVVSEFERVLRMELAEGRIDAQAMRALRRAHERELKKPGGAR